METTFTPISATFGGVLIGLAAASLLYFNGRIAGISGIMGRLLTPARGEVAWRLVFLLGLIAGGIVLLFARPESLAAAPPRSVALIAIAGLLVGFGTSLGSGCTSGHGVCGNARLSKRSMAATAMFMATGAATVFALGLGG
jgi:uncharacterized membrane protein YedE/YeeE